MHYPSDTTLAVYIFGAYVMINSLNQFFVSIYRAFDKMEYEMFVRIIESIVLFLLTMYAIYFQYGLIEIVYAMLLSSIFRLILSGILVIKDFRRPKLEFDFNFVKDVIKKALPFGLTAMFVVIYFRIDTVMLSIMKGDAAVGWYNVAFNIVHGLCALIIGSITGVCLPLMSRHLGSLNDLKKIYIHSFEILFFSGLLISIIITIYSTELIQIIYGVGYSSSSIILKILIWSFFMMGISSISSTLLYSIDKQRIVTVGTGIGALLNVILNLILIPKYSYVGAASATVVTEFVGFVIYFYYSIRFLNIKARDQNVFLWTIKEMSKNLNYKILK
jgi:O-antigen/teichoic acid export membrane protein